MKYVRSMKYELMKWRLFKNLDKKINVILKNILLFPKKEMQDTERRNEWRIYNKMVDINPVTSVCLLKGRVCQTGYKIRPKYMLSTRDALQI